MAILAGVMSNDLSSLGKLGDVLVRIISEAKPDSLCLQVQRWNHLNLPPDGKFLVLATNDQEAFELATVALEPVLDRFRQEESDEG